MSDDSDPMEDDSELSDDDSDSDSDEPLVKKKAKKEKKAE